MDRLSKELFIIVVTLSVAGILTSCARSVNPDIERGTSYQFKEGYPEVRISAIGLLDEEDNGSIHIISDLVYGSLIYRQRDGIHRAEVDLEIQVVGRKDSGFSDSYSTSLEIHYEQDSYYVTSQELFRYEREMKVPPGNYNIYVSVTDKASGKRSTLTDNTYIPNPDENVVNLTSVQLLAKNIDGENNDYMPINTYDVSAAKDSIRFVVQVTNNHSDDPLTVHSRLVRFKADTTPARPMSFNNYSPSSIAYKGIDFRDEEEMDATRRVLEDPGSVLIEYRYALPERGNYRFEVQTEGAGLEKGDELFRARDFSIKSVNYPTLKTPRELAEPLVYLMGRKEHEEMMQIEDPDSLKEAVDRFWLSSVGSISQARGVISLFYERVEQANKQFSSYKEGWKTDPGMIYILFGPPWYVETRLNRMQWSYSYDRSNPNYNYFFEMPRMKNEYFPFYNYLLQRNQNYFTRQYQQVQLWRSGRILYSNL